MQLSNRQKILLVGRARGDFEHPSPADWGHIQDLVGKGLAYSVRPFTLTDEGQFTGWAIFSARSMSVPDNITSDYLFGTIRQQFIINCGMCGDNREVLHTGGIFTKGVQIPDGWRWTDRFGLICDGCKQIAHEASFRFIQQGGEVDQ